MPSSRRRRFSVQNKNRNQEVNTQQNEIQVCPELEEVNLGENINRVKYKSKMHPSVSKNVSTLEILTECKSIASTTTQVNAISTSDKEITASSSNINLYKIMNDQNAVYANESEIEYKNNQKEHYRRERTLHRDKYLHRVVVRSPKRKVSYMSKEVKRKSIGITVAINDRKENLDDVDSNLEVIKQVTEVGENTDREEEEISSHSLGNMCRICHSGDAISESGNLISACSCRGTIGRVHVKCLERWLTESGKSRCELCGTKYNTKRVHRFGIFKAFVMWILSHNSKNMIVDFFGIMIMTPIAVVGASLTERTFARLVAQDHETPWPLASTFVLACMTLVCYYCWIVSALTRHALGWWIWYRSHYEVRLQLPEEE